MNSKVINLSSINLSLIFDAKQWDNKFYVKCISNSLIMNFNRAWEDNYDEQKNSPYMRVQHLYNYNPLKQSIR